MINRESKKLTFWGASPIVFLLTILFAIPVIFLDSCFDPVFDMDFIPGWVLRTIAILLLCAGLPLYFLTIKELKAAYRKKILLTRGFFSVCRNPLFAIVIFLLLPGIILFFNSWLLLTIPLFMYVMFKIFIYREELLMEEEFGREYTDYKKNTPALFPEIWKYME